MPKKTATKTKTKTKTRPVKKTTTRKPTMDAKVAFEELRERLSRVEATLVDLVDLLYKLSEESEEPEQVGGHEQPKPDDNMMVVMTFTENDRVDVDGDVIDVG